jgi:hypothetical protein
MNKKVIMLIAIVLIAVAISAGLLFFFTYKTQEQIVNPPVASQIDNSDEMAADLQTAFTKATSTLGLPKESIFMVSAYSGDEKNPTEVNFASDTATSSSFYMASTIKPIYLAAYLKILDIKDLDYKVDFKFIDDGTTLETLAQNISDKINYNFDEDVLLDEFILPYFKDYTSISKEEVLEILKTNPELANYQFALKDIIKYTLGPSSNTGLTLLKSDIGIKKGLDEEKSANLVEEYLNKILVDKGFTGSIVINKSTKSVSGQTFNSVKFEEMQ